MRIRRDHERRYHHHKGEWSITIGRSRNVHFRFHMTTPRHRFNFAVDRKGYTPWWIEAEQQRAKLRPV